jgi:hypothetical protein
MPGIVNVLNPVYAISGFSNLPLAGGTVEIFQAGTSTYATYYSDYLATVGASGPIEIPTSGKVEAWVDDAVDVRIEDADGNLIGFWGNCGTPIGELYKDGDEVGEVLSRANGGLSIYNGLTGIAGTPKRALNYYDLELFFFNTSDQTISTTVQTNLTGLQLNVPQSPKYYKFKAVLGVQFTASATGIVLSFGSATGSSPSLKQASASLFDGTGLVDADVDMAQTDITNTSLTLAYTTVGNDHVVVIEGVLESASVGTLFLTAARSGGSGNVVIKEGSFISLKGLTGAE